jgi:ubiquinol-cytochrome c reductase cytochrome b subunit
VLAYVITYRICLGLQRSDADLIGHGVPTGVIRRLPGGAFTEAHTPLAEDIEAHLRGKEAVPVLTAPNGSSVPPPRMRGPVGRLRARMSAEYGGQKVPLDEEQERDRSLTP